SSHQLPLTLLCSHDVAPLSWCSLLLLLSSFLTLRRPPSSPLFPYTTLFRSDVDPGAEPARVDRVEQVEDLADRLDVRAAADVERSEEHTFELQSLTNLVCRLLLEKKNTKMSQQHGQSATYPTYQHSPRTTTH